ncbi:FAD-dependent oxidoreductase [Pseudactinotalea suaedae]|uniref:FAD-dependent oxidoreductase n=1 Tax=Pseudactinotalea suaedae TaxID=1524924 RepID=UPI0012E0EFF4|nr:cyclic nucleotide-binding domain-containing thioredoxin-disulfide reductase [Pseudactinotalea suaedae]
MITSAELREVPLFAALEQPALDHLVGAVEDIHLVPGEYFAHEGDERSLFVVLEGHVEITKIVNGDERVIGERTHGMAFGEVPMTLSTKFPASGRATRASRVLRLGPAEYYTLAAMAPSVTTTVGDVARGYLGDLQTWAATQPDPVARLHGPRVDARVRELATFLTRNQVAIERVLPDGDVVTDPVLELRDGTRLLAPTMREAAVAVGLDVEPTHEEYDVVILGAGPAGLTAAVNAAAEGLRTLVVECLAPGGQAGTSSRIENYTGFPFGVSGDELASRALQQAKRLGAEIVVTRSVTSLTPGEHAVVLDGGQTLRARVIMIATGVEWRTLGVANVESYLGRGVYYGAARSDAALTAGQDIVIIGAGNSAGQAAIFFSRFARSVTMLVRGASLETSMSRYLIDQIAANSAIRVETRSQVVALHGEADLEEIEVRGPDAETGSTTRRPARVLFVMIGADAVTQWLPQEIARDEHGFVATGPDAAERGHWALARRPFALETSVPGIFAIGDVRSGSVKRVAAGVGEGGMGIAFVHQYLALV